MGDVGTFLLRSLPDRMKEHVRYHAAAQQVSMNTLILRYIHEGIVRDAIEAEANGIALSPNELYRIWAQIKEQSDGPLRQLGRRDGRMGRRHGR
jgi:hypothetical protein